MRKLLLAAVVVAGFSAPAAATTGERLQDICKGHEDPLVSMNLRGVCSGFILVPNDKRAAQLEKQEERGEGMDGVVVQMMHLYRQLADAYALVIRDQEHPRIN